MSIKAKDTSTYKPPEGQVRNPKQSKLVPSSSNPRYIQIRSYQKRINTLEKALRRLIKEMRVPAMIDEYTQILEEGVRTYRPRKKYSEFQGVHWFALRKKWKSRTTKKQPDGTEKLYEDYHDDEYEAALAYDQKVRRYHPDKLWLLNFATPEEIGSPQMYPRGVREKRSFLYKHLNKHLSSKEARKVCPTGLNFATDKQCNILLAYLERKTGIRFE